MNSEQWTVKRLPPTVNCQLQVTIYISQITTKDEKIVRRWENLFICHSLSQLQAENFHGVTSTNPIQAELQSMFQVHKILKF